MIVTKISTATPMCWTGNMYKLLGIRFHVWAWCKSKMAAINRKYMINYHSSARIYVSNNISTAMPMFTEFSYSSVIFSLLLPVNGRHLWLTTCPYIDSQSIRVAWPRKHGCSRLNIVAIMYASYTSYPIYFRLMTAIFCLRHTQT